MPLITRMGRFIGLCLLLLLLIGFVHAASLMYLAAGLCLAALVVGALAARRAVRDLTCRREAPVSTAYAGDPFENVVHIVEKRPRWRLLELFDEHMNLVTGRTRVLRVLLMTEGGAGTHVLVAGRRTPVRVNEAGERVLVIRDIVRFPQRGHYRLGPLKLVAQDPFGLVSFTQAASVEHEVIVYPRPLAVPEVLLGGLGGRREAEVRPVGHAGESADFHGIRPYVQGDDLRHVHWKATAHTGRLAVKEFEYRFSGAVQVILDLRQGIYLGEGEMSSLEAAVTLAASVLDHVIGQGNNAGLVATREQVIALQPESGHRQLIRALETLALARDDGEVSLTEALASGVVNTERRNTAIVITADTDMRVIGSLLALRGRSAQVLLVLLNARSFHEKSKELAERPTWLSQVGSTRLEDLFGGVKGGSEQALPTEEDFLRLLHGANAAGIEVLPVAAGASLQQVLQGIRTRL